MRRLAWTVLLIAGVLGAALVGGTAWLLGTPGGLRWALARAEAFAAGDLEIAGASGTLAGTVSIERLVYRAPGVELEARKLAARADLLAVLGARLHLERLQAASLALDLDQRPGAGGPAGELRLPFPLRLDEARIERVELRRDGHHEVLLDLSVKDARIDASTVALAASFARADERFPAQVAVEANGAPRRFTLTARGNIAGIEAEAKAVVSPFADRKLERLEASAGPVDLSALDPSLPATAVALQIAGEASTAHALAGNLSATNRTPGPLDEGRLPASSLQARFATVDFMAATLEEVNVALPGGGTLRGSAKIDRQSLDAALEAAALDLRRIRSSLRETRLRGPLRIRVTSDTQALSGRLSQEDLSVTAELERRGELVEVRALSARARGGELTGRGELRLSEPLAFDARVSLAGFDPAAFGNYPGGSLNGQVEASGTWGERKALDAKWTISESRLLGHALSSEGRARTDGTRVTAAQAQVSLGRAKLELSGALGVRGEKLVWRLVVPRLEEFRANLAGAVQASGALTGAWGRPEATVSVGIEALGLPGGMVFQRATIEAQGRLDSHVVDIGARAPGIDLEARLQGGWRTGRGWSGKLTRLSNAGPYPLRLAAPAPLELGADRAELGRLEARLGDGRLLVRGVSWVDGRLNSSGEFSGLPAQWLALGIGAERVHATLLLDGEWELAAAPTVEGRLRVKRASGDVAIGEDERVALGLSEAALEARLTGERLLARASLASRFGRVDLDGELGRLPDAGTLGIGRHSPLAFDARIQFASLAVLAGPLAGAAQLDGELQAELQGSGTAGEPRLRGVLAGKALRFDLPVYGVYLRGGTLRALLEGDRLRLEQFSIRGGRGTLTASGTLPLSRHGAATLEWRAKSLTVLDRADRRLVASGQGEAGFDGNRLHLGGRLRAERGYFELRRERLPQLGDDVVVVGRDKPRRGEGAPLPLSLALVVDLGEDLEVSGRGLEGKLAGKVELQTSPEGELRAYGRLHTVNATFLAYGQRLQVDPGVLIFDGPIDNPSLQITAWRRNQAVEAGVQVTGTARAPRVQLVSQPPVPEGEQLSWLVLGRAPSNATQADLGLLQAAAGALLSRGDSLPLDRRVARAVGLDEVALRGSGELQENVVAVGKRLSDRLYVSYEHGLGAVAANLVRLDLALSQRWSLRAETGSSSGWGLYYRFSWD